MTGNKTFVTYPLGQQWSRCKQVSRCSLEGKKTTVTHLWTKVLLIWLCIHDIFNRNKNHSANPTQKGQFPQAILGTTFSLEGCGKIWQKYWTKLGAAEISNLEFVTYKLKDLNEIAPGQIIVLRCPHCAVSIVFSIILWAFVISWLCCFFLQTYLK